MTPEELKAQFNTAIRQQTAANSISPDSLADQLDALVDWGTQPNAIATLTYATTVNIDFSVSEEFYITLAGDVIFSFSNVVPGKNRLVFINNGAAGPRTVNFPGTAILKPDLAIAEGANELTVISLIPIAQGVLVEGSVYGEIAGGGGGTPTLATPTGLTITPGDSLLALDWNDVPNATGYTVQRATDAGFTTGLSTTNLSGGSNSSYNQFASPNGTLFYVRVKATAAGYTDSGWATGSGTPAIGIDAIPNQYIWQADEASTLTTNGSEVSEWREKLNTSENFVMASDRPILNTSGGPNGKPYIVTSTTFYQDSPIPSSPATYYMVCRLPATRNGELLMVNDTMGGINGLRHEVTPDENYTRFYIGVAPYYTNQMYNLDRRIWMLIKVAIPDSNSIIIELNDEATTFNQLDSAGGNAYPLAYLGFQNYQDMEIAEVRAFSRIPTAQEDAQIKSALIGKYNLVPPAKQILVFGDSHTVGVQITTPKYLSKMTKNTSISIIDMATSGTCAALQNGVADLPDIIANYNYHAVKNNHCWVHFQYGTNDAAVSYPGNAGFTTWDDWKIAYKAHIQTFITNGFDPQKIILFTPPYSTGAYVRGQLPIIRTKILEIVTELNVQLVDWYQLCQTNGLDCAASVDGIHATSPMHDLAYDAIISIMGT